MPLPEPIRMSRVAVVAPRDRLRDALATVADLGLVEIDVPTDNLADAAPDQALRRAGVPADVVPLLASQAPDLERLEQEQRWDLLAGEAALRRYASTALEHGPVAGLVGWAPLRGLPELRDRLAAEGAAVVELPVPRGVEPPTMLRTDTHGSMSPLVETYGTVHYADVDPTVFAGVTYVLMFGMMFGDVGHGLLLAALGLALRWVRWERIASIRRMWVLPVAAGAVGSVFGVLYGEAFGPTGLVPALWLEPLEDPVRLLVAAAAVGVVLLAVSYGIGSVNRWREAGPVYALLSASGLAGLTIVIAFVLLAGGIFWSAPLLVVAGLVALGAGMVLMAVGLLVHSEPGGGRWMQAGVELLDGVIRIGTNIVSFTRLAAFGLTHAAIGDVVWFATTSLWGAGAGGAIAAVVVFLVGNVVAFALEVLVVGVQALRLEYYELFSRIFVGEGRPFRPWHVPVDGSTSQAGDSAEEPVPATTATEGSR